MNIIISTWPWADLQMILQIKNEGERQLVVTRTFVGELLYLSSQVYTAVADLTKFQPDEPQRIG